MQAILRHLGLALGGEAGARLAKQFGMPCSPDTLLRLLHQAPLPPIPTPRVLGLDDWSFLKGRRFGTLLVDLEQHRPVDLLPDREGPTLASWLLAHPGVEIVSRDRSTIYAEAIRLGAPQALQVADRWHLMKNLGEAVETFLLHKKAALKAALPDTPGPPAGPPDSTSWHTSRTRQAEAASLARHARRVERYHFIHARFALGVDRETSAAELGVNRKTVYR